MGTLAQAEALLRGGGGGHAIPLAGWMIGRAAFHSPFRLADADRRLCGAASNPGLSRREVARHYAAYAEATWAEEAAALEAEVRKEMDAAGERETTQAVKARLRPRLRALRERLYQPLQHLFADDGAAGAAYEQRLLQAWERQMPVAKGVQHALRCVPDDLADHVGEVAPGG